MKSLFVLCVSAVLATAGTAHAQDRLLQDAPIGSEVILASDVVPGDAGQLDEYGLVEERPALPPRMIAQMLNSRGFSALSPPIRRGPAYVVAVIDPNGEDGRVTVDAFSGRIVRFRPVAGPYYGPGAMVLPDDVRGAYARRDLVPPRSIPFVSSRQAPKAANSGAPPRLASKSAAPLPVPRSGLPTTAAEQASQKTAAAATTTGSAPAGPAGTKPAVALQATQPIPPVQGFE